jgi:hypothetical protein
MGQHVALEPIAGATSRDEVTGHVRATARHGVDVVQRGDAGIEGAAAVHAAAAAIPHRRAFERALEVPGE